MNLKVVIFIMSLSQTLAYPLQEAAWVGSDYNQIHEKKDLSKDVHRIYKSAIDSSGLYHQQDDDTKNPVAAEMQRKLFMESERLRVRLSQELAELWERLSPSPANLSATLASMKERLTPLTQQLQTSLSSNTQDLCSQLSVFLQSLEAAEGQTEAGSALYQEAFHWIRQTLDHSSLQTANIIADFHTMAINKAKNLKRAGTFEDEDEEENNSKIWQAVSTKLGQEVSSLKEEAQARVGALKAQFAALLESTQPLKAEVAGSVEQFCQNAALQSQVLQARMERLFIGVEEEVLGASPQYQPPSMSTQAGSLQEDFSIRLSALIQDIMHSVQ
ncbi:apolipoprotein A-IV [Nothobranchius furzeri]|uniref:LOC107380335-like protein n=2 Tax=Nothobranchius furzeri TaxID=105023 RepID=A0A8C6PG25_NOTFU|nr:uncharacterized protein zgc:162608 [Nothobranchius furzeri]KAF7218933.1 putative LOC107380335-like protein [Nothobranchius furzeri]